MDIRSTDYPAEMTMRLAVAVASLSNDNEAMIFTYQNPKSTDQNPYQISDRPIIQRK